MSTYRAMAAGVLSITLAATSAQAGGFAEPEVMEAEIIIDETAATSAGNVWVPLILLAAIAAAVAASGGGGGTPVPAGPIPSIPVVPAIVGGGFGPA